MKVFFSRKYNHYEQFYVDALRWNLEFIKLDKGDFSGQIELIDIGNIQIGSVSLSGKIEQHGVSPTGFRTFVIPANKNQSFNWLNRNVNHRDLLVFSSAGYLEALSFNDFHYYMISIAEDLLENIIRENQFNYLNNHLDSSEKVIPLNYGYFVNIQSYLQTIFEQLRTHPQLLKSASMIYQLRNRLPFKLLNFLDRIKTDTKAPLSRKRDHAILKCQNYIRDKSMNAISLPTLAEISNISERTLELAFLERFELTPKAYINRVKLNEVNQKLLSSKKHEQISSIAREIGFNHLSQFAANYRNLFGELPRETLLRR